MNARRALGVSLAALLFSCTLFPVSGALAVPPAGAQYGVGIPTPAGPSTPSAEPVARPGNLPPQAERALADLGVAEGPSDAAGTSDPRASAEERRQLRIVGSSTELGAPGGGGPEAAPGRLEAHDDTDFLGAAGAALGGLSLPFVLLLLAVAGVLAVAGRRGGGRDARGPEAP